MVNSMNPYVAFVKKRIQQIIPLLCLTLGLPSIGLAQAATNLQFGLVNGGSAPSAGVPFQVVVNSTDVVSTPQNVLLSTTVSLSLASGSGVLGVPE